MAITNTHAVLLCPPGMGHIIPYLELAKRLVTHQIIPKVTFFLASIKNSGSSQAEAKVLQSAKEAKLFDIIQLPPVDTNTVVSPGANLGIKLAVIMQQITPLLLSSISTMTTKPTIFITELFGCLALPVADKLRMSKYVFLPSNAWLLALSLHAPTLDKNMQGQYWDQNKPLPIPGCKPIHPTDLFSPFLDRTDQLYHEYLRMSEQLKMADGILVNTFYELEPKTLAALSSGEITKVPVYPVGPLIRETRENGEGKRSDVFDWLDKQDEESVIYVSLGSGYTMSYEQIKEMALGLELSGKKFVWSIRPPSTKAGYDNYLTAGEDAQTTNGVSILQPSNYFLHEFYRLQSMGIMVMDWAPQLEILRHPSIGGFVSHCGWNSVLESVSCGVPMVGWPLFADQMMNAAMLAEEAGIAVRVEVPPFTNVMGREEIAKAIRKIMDKEDAEGCAIRNRVKELKHISERAWPVDGSSSFALSKMASVFSKIPQSNGL